MLLTPIPPDMVPFLLVVATPRFKSATNTTLINPSTLGGSNEAVAANTSPWNDSIARLVLVTDELSFV